MTVINTEKFIDKDVRKNRNFKSETYLVIRGSWNTWNTWNNYIVESSAVV